MSPAISFFATGIDRSDGGIATANRTVREALGEFAERTGASLDIHILHEGSNSAFVTSEKTGSWNEFLYNGNKIRMAVSILRALLSSGLVVFDHVHLATPLVPLRMLPRSLRAKSLVFAHGSESWKRIKPSSIKAFQMADLVLTNSVYTLQHMRETFAGFSGEACPLGLSHHFPLTPVPPLRSTERPSLIGADGKERKLGGRVMLLVARMDAAEREKGHRELIEVLPRVREQVPEAELVLVGDGSDSHALSEIASASSSASHIFLPGRVDDALLSALYAAAYAYVMPSRQEGFGIVYLEAMNHALPCLACRKDGAADVVVDGETGFLIEQPIQQNELVDAIVALLTSPTRARQMGEAGWRRLNERFTAEAYQARVVSALQRLMK